MPLHCPGWQTDWPGKGEQGWQHHWKMLMNDPSSGKCVVCNGSGLGIGPAGHSPVLAPKAPFGFFHCFQMNGLELVTVAYKGWCGFQISPFSVRLAVQILKYKLCCPVYLWCTDCKARQLASNKTPALCAGATRWCMLYLEKLHVTVSG